MNKVSLPVVIFRFLLRDTDTQQLTFVSSLTHIYLYESRSSLLTRSVTKVCCQMQNVLRLAVNLSTFQFIVVSLYIP